MYVASLFLLYFVIYSLLGWICEVFYIRVDEKRWRDTGFLTLPLLPIYGFGALSILLVVGPYVHNPVLVFAASAVIATVIEYIGHWLLDRLFHIRLWDYSRNRFNLHGRICLANTVGFGLLALLTIYVIHPFVTDVAAGLPTTITVIIAIVLLSAIAIDFARSIGSMIKLRVAIDKHDGSIEDIHALVDQRIADLRQLRAKLARRPGIRIAGLRVHRQNIKRLERSFPNLSLAPKAKRPSSKRSSR